MEFFENHTLGEEGTEFEEELEEEELNEWEDEGGALLEEDLEDWDEIDPVDDYEYVGEI